LRDKTVDLEYFGDPPPPPPKAAPLGTTAGTVPCPKCGRPAGARPGTPGYVIAECPRCGSTLVAAQMAGSGGTG
jgi:hypothetical protein